LKNTLRLGWEAIACPKGSSRMDYLRGVEILPYYFGHNACACFFINDASMINDVLNHILDLETNQEGEPRFQVVQIESIEACFRRVECTQGA
jgi:hypothetical protein